MIEFTPENWEAMGRSVRESVEHNQRKIMSEVVPCQTEAHLRKLTTQTRGELRILVHRLSKYPTLHPRQAEKLEAAKAEQARSKEVYFQHVYNCSDCEALNAHQ